MTESNTKMPEKDKIIDEIGEIGHKKWAYPDSSTC